VQQMWRKLPAMSREEWLEWRKGGIGGSDATAILGVSPWSTPYKIYMEKVKDFQQKETYAMLFGRETECQSRQEFESLMDESFFPINVERRDIPWIKSSLDGINMDGNKVVEIKKANKKDHSLAKEGKVPPKYYPQCQHILQTLGLSGMYYFSSPSDGERGVIVEVERDEEYIRKVLFPQEEEFWKGVCNKTPPRMTLKDVKTFGIAF
jgi:putative phage-type endonuclease